MPTEPTTPELIDLLRQLTEWDAEQGGNAAPVWTRARELLDQHRDVLADALPRQTRRILARIAATITPLIGYIEDIRCDTPANEAAVRVLTDLRINVRLRELRMDLMMNPPKADPQT